GVYTSCSDDNLANNGEPRIRYIRVTRPEASDSLLVGAYQSNLIAIMGDNLQGVQQIWFNDQEASLTPTYITNTSVLLTVPSRIPLLINNKLTMVFGEGKTLEHDFTVEISEPEVVSMNSEFVPTGKIATIRGNYFYEPITVTFTGGVEAQLAS